jgi:putative transposase
MKLRYKGHRFPPEIISCAVWLYHRFTLSLRDVEDLLAERGIIVSYEAIRFWCKKFGPEYARTLRKKQRPLGDIWHVDELFVKIRGEQHYLWRAVDQDGDVLDILVTKSRNKKAAKRFFRKVLKGQGQPPWRLITDKLTSYPAAHREVFPSVEHRTGQYENNRAEVSHQHTREQERQVRRFKSMEQAQRLFAVNGQVQNLFRVGRQHLKAVHHRLLRDRAFAVWKEVTCAH